MKKEHAQKWVDALRSGKYKQTTEVLKAYGAYCCLGVACEIFPKMNLRGDNNPDENLKNFKKLGLRSAEGRLTDTVGFDIVDLASLNDGYTLYGKFTFDEIADVIQIEYIEGL